MCLVLAQKQCLTIYLMSNSPCSLSTARTLSRSSEFMFSHRTVARPIGVKPTTMTSSNAKCSCHDCVRGLKSGTSSFVTESKEVRFGPLNRLQCGHASARFMGASSPPCCLARICSMWKRTTTAYVCGIRQYSHRLPARSQTRWRIASSISWPYSVQEPCEPLPAEP